MCTFCAEVGHLKFHETSCAQRWPHEIDYSILDFLKTAHEISMSALWPHYVHMVPPRGPLKIPWNTMSALMAHIEILVKLSVPHKNHRSFEGELWHSRSGS